MLPTCGEVSDMSVLAGHTCCVYSILRAQIIRMTQCGIIDVLLKHEYQQKLGLASYAYTKRENKSMYALNMRTTKPRVVVRML